jgi:magnesium chelatase family protein
MFAKTYSATIYGIQGYPVQVEADVSNGLPSFDMVGILASEVRESRERIRTALHNAGFPIPPKRITINLSPADQRKRGAGFDLPIAVSILSALSILPQNHLEGCMFCGELSLNGNILPIRGILSIVLCARENGFQKCIIPKDNLSEGCAIEGIDIIGVSTIQELIYIFSCSEHIIKAITPAQTYCPQFPDRLYPVDFCDIYGQKALKRAIEIATCGMHNLLMIGPPGCGKSMAAQRIPTILPVLSREESIEITQIYSVCGLLPPNASLMQVRPFRSPHHTIPPTTLIGGGRYPQPGEISLANRGVLFMDELPEFSKTTLEVLRQPLEDRKVTISRLHGSYTFPADTMLVAAMNPCKCGYYPDKTRCKCSPYDVKHYLHHISRPLLDRIDISIQVPELSWQELTNTSHKPECSDMIRERVIRTQQIQKERFKNTSIQFNSQMNPRQIEQFCTLNPPERQQLEKITRRNPLTTRSYHKILKISRTIADLESSEQIQTKHLYEAFGYRMPDVFQK